MSPFEQRYPHIARWVKTEGWVEIGDDGMSRSWIRALDEGGLVWEGGDPSKTLDEAFREMDMALADWMRERSGE